KRKPAKYPKLATAAVTTHDLPTVAGLWTGHDLAEQQAIGVGDEQAVRAVRRRFAALTGVPEGTPPAQVVAAAYEALGKAPSLVLSASLDDALGVEDRPNLPGTTARQRPNWCLALPGGIEALETSDLPRRIARALSRSPGALGPKTPQGPDGA
ncbi:MAG: 4-alpha-glucanotransferase, partial [Thermoguttaceae bacterium]|nr:4-alpha-glucanotransferase [Thermoguttaceae bacterium]